MLQTDFIVVNVMRRGDLETSRAELHIHIFVEDEGDLAVNHRDDDMFALQVRETFVCRIGTNGGVTQDGLRAGGCNGDVALFTHYFVADKIEFRLLFGVDNLLVRDGGERLRIPVDHPHSAVDKPFVVEIDKDFDD